MRRRLGLGANQMSCLLAIAAVSLVTHPIAWWVCAAVLPPVVPDFWIRLALVEVGLAGGEGVLLAYALRLRVEATLALALILNGASSVIGVVAFGEVSSRFSGV